MADDYEFEGDWADMMDDGWLYVEDEFDLADELAEGQVPDPGYAGTSHELALEDYEFDLYAYFDDLEYGDDSYWDYERQTGDGKAGQKRKRGVTKEEVKDKRQKTHDRDAEPMLFRSRDERNSLFKQDAPLLKARVPFAFLADWRERFAGVDGIVVKEMPADMKEAAESQVDDTPENQVHFVDGEEEEGDWEDEEDDNGEDEESEEGGDMAIDPEMLKQILKQKLGEAGLDGMDEEGFMDTLKMMLAGEEGADDAAGTLANSLLGKLTSDTGDEALSGWLSQQGVSLENDDDASSVATADQEESQRHAAASKQRPQDTPPDSAVSGVNGIEGEGKPTEMALHGSSPTASSNKKKRAAAEMESTSRKRSKKVTFDVPSSSDSQSAQDTAAAVALTSGDQLLSEPNFTQKTRTANKAAVRSNNTATAEEPIPNGETAPAEASKKSTRKRKATSAETMEEKPAQKKARSKELQDLELLPSTPSPGPPSRRTRNARAKAGK